MKTLPGPTTSKEEVRRIRDEMAERELLHMREEWVAAGHEAPSLNFLNNLARYKKNIPGLSNNFGTERDGAAAWRDIPGKKNRRRHSSRHSSLRRFDDVTGIYAYPPMIASLFSFFIIAPFACICLVIPVEQSCG